ncbi:MAG: hypothetical protein A2142_09085 [candidate division Zixibacteria bacterium RBG_16_48_11]|nr:MAG: hypothetical protein A2142_09085 [candidate division Zixibacteria bacterium RBG_16_48_11]
MGRLEKLCRINLACPKAVFLEREKPHLNPLLKKEGIKADCHAPSTSLPSGTEPLRVEDRARNDCYILLFYIGFRGSR